MNSISEARELRSRIHRATASLYAASNENYIIINNPELMTIQKSCSKMLDFAKRVVDDLIEEWDAEKGIDRPL